MHDLDESYPRSVRGKSSHAFDLFTGSGCSPAFLVTFDQVAIVKRNAWLAALSCPPPRCAEREIRPLVSCNWLALVGCERIPCPPRIANFPFQRHHVLGIATVHYPAVVLRSLATRTLYIHTCTSLAMMSTYLGRSVMVNTPSYLPLCYLFGV